jgi:hypothetical protein
VDRVDEARAAVVDHDGREGDEEVLGGVELDEVIGHGLLEAARQREGVHARLGDGEEAGLDALAGRVHAGHAQAHVRILALEQEVVDEGDLGDGARQLGDQQGGAVHGVERGLGVVEPPRRLHLLEGLHGLTR